MIKQFNQAFTMLFTFITTLCEALNRTANALNQAAKLAETGMVQFNNEAELERTAALRKLQADLDATA